ncbi:MAG: hypothetical protein V7767_10870 [Leeuwenhoekiella sp.]
MFLDVWKRKSIKRNIQKLIDSNSGVQAATRIINVGIIVDFLDYKDLEALKKLASGLGKDIKCEIIYLVSDLKKEDELSRNKFDSTALTWQGKVKNDDVSQFIEKPFDLLISYYRSENLILQYITAKSSALFKAGFPSETFQLNDLAINVNIEDNSAFEKELNKYLKILNRIE